MIVGLKIVVHSPILDGIDTEMFLYGAVVGCAEICGVDIEKNSTGGSSHRVNCGTKEVTIWLWLVTATGSALGEGVMYVRTAVVEACTPTGVDIERGACRFPTLTASCLCW